MAGVIRKQMKVIVTLFFLLYCAGHTYSQSRQIREVIDRGGYDYIPSQYLTDSTLGVTHSYRLFENDSDKKSFEIFWSSFCTDGRYYLTITPEQIYLTSSHENPNPSSLYWVLSIDNSIYRQILKGFREEQKQYYYFDESYEEDKLLKEDSSNCDFLLEKQIDIYFSRMNKFIEDKKQKLDKAKRIMPKKVIYYGYNREQIENWTTSIIINNE